MRDPLGLACALVAALAPAPTGQEPPSLLPAERIAELVQAEVAPYAAAGDFMGAILVASGEEVLFRRAFGSASLELDAPNTPETVFGIASVSKYLTALAVVRLAEQERLSLDDPLARFLPDFPGGADITLRHLLGHRAGIRHSGFAQGDGGAELATPVSSAALVRRIGEYERVGAPGERRVYSTAGYSVLAHVVEVVTGRGYEAAMRLLVFEPAGMRATGDLAGRALIPRRAAGYEPGFGGALRRARPIAFENKLGGGSLYSCIDDLHRLALALDRGRIVSPAGLELVEGSGWGGDRMRNGTLSFFGSNGAIDGYMSLFDQYRDAELTVVLLANVNTGAREVLRDALLSIPLGLAFERPAPPRRAPVEDASRLDDYLGTYRITPTLVWTVTRHGEQLGIGNDPNHVLPLEFNGPDRFFLRARYSELRFVRERLGDADLVVGIDWLEGGRQFDCPRLE